ncbi:unnamed protein product [Effrenium voratum]|uniref:Uncharacterized protein n=1 Tax=Effrenium voratum TaxID=2562239 RepID=A0AA36J3L8_9DINO|nr:unnamed protein product [Effrenium voratum]
MEQDMKSTVRLVEVTAIPQRLSSHLGLKGDPNGAVMRGYTNDWCGRSVEGRLVDVHRLLVSGSAVAKKNVVILDGNEGWIIPRDSKIGKGVRAARDNLLNQNYTEAKMVTKMHKKKGISLFDLWMDKRTKMNGVDAKAAGSETAVSPEGEESAEGEGGRKPKLLRLPVTPTADEIEDTIYRTWLPSLQIKDERTGFVWASVVPAKGVDLYAVNFAIQSDRVAVRETKRQVRAMKSALEEKMGLKIHSRSYVQGAYDTMREGLLLGAHGRNGEALIMTEEGVIKGGISMSLCSTSVLRSTLWDLAGGPTMMALQPSQPGGSVSLPDFGSAGARKATNGRSSGRQPFTEKSQVPRKKREGEERSPPRELIPLLQASVRCSGWTRRLYLRQYKMNQLYQSLGMSGVDVAEIYNPERFTSKANAFGLQPGFAIDLTLQKDDKGNHWDLS